MNPRIQGLLERAKSTVAHVEAEGRRITEAEKQEIERLIAEATSIHELETKTREIDNLLGTGNGAGDGLFAAFKAAGWAPGKRVSVSREHLKTPTFTGDADDLSPARREGVPLGFDQRYLAPVFPSEGIGADVTSVQVMRQSSRTLPAPADVQRTLMQTDEKAEVENVREMVAASVGQLAAKESAIPNALLLQNGVRSMVNVDLQLALLEGRDDSILDKIIAAGPAVAGATGIDLTAQIVLAEAEMADDGYAGSVVAINPLDYAAIELLRGADEQFARRDPLARFRFAVSKSVGAPLLIDPSAAGRRYEGPLSLQSFEEADGATNTSLIRLEQSFLFNVERIDAIRYIGSAS